MKGYKTRDERNLEFFRHWNSLEARYTSEGLEVGNYKVTYTWEKRLMQEFARAVTTGGGDVLEIGFGMGLAATYMQQFGARSHTIIEPHPQIFAVALEWKERFTSDLHLINDFWQNTIDDLKEYDGILYDPFSPDEVIDKDSFAFFALAAERLLRPGGRLAFWYKGDSLALPYQRELLKHFSQLVILPVHGLKPTEACKSQGFTSTMIVPVAVK